jgi:carbonic anhydrase/acetyltransferase-like protein (isoleucine patch superfamily)
MKVRSFRGKRPGFGERVFVASTAVLIGDVELGDDVNIWYGVVLRGDINRIVIGARSNVQDNAVIHVDAPNAPTIVGADVTIGHSAILHGCTVERGALIGMQSTVLNGAVIGEEAVVAAGALVPPAMVVPARTLVAGVPAKPRGEVAPEMIEHTRRGVSTYLELKGRYMADDDEAEVADPAECRKVAR